ncbi:hypothetical protein [Chryseobacterium sp.]|uniref:hypothetical protein n=1 Tax=Chryseobacterium sp. TaxID=1871047 RepID=UPI0025BA8C5B|nr:hypothetical protein [Chryseobacterium sp.]MBV8327466.1 hypothetical protein [Chryseobacterium sp.]
MKTKKLFTVILLLFAVYGWGQNINQTEREMMVYDKKPDSLKKEGKEINTKIQSADTLSLLSKLVFLNAYNFSSPTSLKSNYVWQLGLMAPDLGKTRWGFNAGFTGIDYSVTPETEDNIRVLRQIDYVAQSPLDQVKQGSEYYQQLNEYSFEVKNSSFSVYVQPLFRLTDSKSNQKIFIHTHFELYNSKNMTTTTIKTILQKTLVYDSVQKTVVKHNINGDTQVQKSSLLTGYFGIGATFYLQDNRQKWEFFVQPTIGFSVSGQNFGKREDSSSFSFPAYGYESRHIAYGFYLIRAHIAYRLTGKKTSLIIGTDIRGFLPYYSPQYAVYAGINLGVEDILSLLQ